MAFKHGVSEGAINGFPRSNKLLEDFFKNTFRRHGGNYQRRIYRFDRKERRA